MKPDLSATDSLPAFLCIGHFCHDQHEEGLLLGGTASYCSLMVQKLGLPTAVLTSYGPDFSFSERFREAGITLQLKPARETTLFQNVYSGDQRVQYMHQRAETLYLSDLPQAWRAIPVVKFCLIAGEADYSLLTAFPDAFVTATIQGWLRRRAEDGRIRPEEMDWQQLKSLDAVLLSDEDLLGMEHRLPLIVSLVPIVVITHGRDGATVYQQGQASFFPSYPVAAVDPTGAGDVFAAAFVVDYVRNRDVASAAAFAHCAASLIVERVGVDLPGPEAITERLIDYQRMFGGSG